MKKILVLFISILLNGIVHGHGTSNIEGKIAFDSKLVVPGKLVTFQVLLRELEPRVMEDLKVFARIGQGFENEKVELARKSYTKFTLPITLEEGRYNVRIYLLRDGIEEIGMNGFIVQTNSVILTERDSELWFVPKGMSEPIPWLEHLSGFLVVIAGFGLSYFLYKRINTVTIEKSTKKKPAWVLTVAALASLSMPFGAYWDISFHNTSGRESFFQPPHLLIYGGIIALMVIVGYSIGLKNRGTKWMEHLKQDRFAFYALIALLLQLSSAPFDEIWHTVFGLDVSVWSPPHVILIFGGVAVCLFFSAFSVKQESTVTRISRITILAGALLICQVFLAEYEFQTPSWHISQFRPSWIFPFMIMIFSIVICLAAQIQKPFRYPATKVILSFLLLRYLVVIFLKAVGCTALPGFSIWLFVALPVAMIVDLFSKRPLAVNARIPIAI